MLRSTLMGIALLVAGAEATTAQSFGDGTHIVGFDIQPGVYRAPGGASCDWRRLSGLGGTTDEIIAMDVFQKTPTVEIKAGDKAFKSTSCGTWEHVEVSASSGGDDEAASSKTLTDATAMFLVSLVAAVNDSVDQELADRIFAKGLYSVKQLVAQPKYKHISPEVIDMLYDAMLGR